MLKRQFTRWIRFFSLVGLCAWLVILPGYRRGSAAAAVQSNGDPLVEVDAGGIQVSWTAGEVEISQGVDGALDRAGTVQVAVAGFQHAARPGMFDLPSRSLLLALPAGARPELEILAASRDSLALPGMPRRVALPAGEAAEALETAEVELTEIGVMRGVRLARLDFYPVHRASQDWEFTRKINLRVNYSAPGSFAVQEGAFFSQSDPMLSAVMGMVANPTQVAVTRSIAVGRAIPASQGSDTGVAVIQAPGPGLVFVSYETLAAARITLDGLVPVNLGVWQGDQAVAYDWLGDTDAKFEPGEGVVFFSQPRASRWITGDIYLLKQHASAGLRVNTRSAAPGGLSAGVMLRDKLFEENKIYTPDCYCGSLPIARDGDRWVWEALSRPGKPSVSIPFSLSSLNPAVNGELSLWLISQTTMAANPDHRVQVTLNGIDLGLVEWDGRMRLERTFTVSAGVLRQGENTLTLSLPGIDGISVEGAWLDAFQVRYAPQAAVLAANADLYGDAAPHRYQLTLPEVTGLRLYDVTDPAAPLALTGWQVSNLQVTFSDGDAGERRYAYSTRSAMLNPLAVRAYKNLQAAPNPQVAYLVITHPTFLPAAQALAALRQKQGLPARVEDLQAIYDAYSAGVPQPEAIRDYLEDAYLTWPAPPQYVLLVGDGTADPRKYLSSSPTTFLPPFLADVDPWAGETAADNRFISVDGVDDLPDMAIGRLPVNNLTEANTVVQKIIQYETAPNLGTWEREVNLIADNPDDGGNYAALASAIAAPLGTPYSVNLHEYFDSVDPAVFRQDIAAMLNQGAGTLIYAGHASIHQWGSENFLHISQVTQQANGKRLPFLIEMTCLTASFQVPGLDSIDEAQLRYADGGVVAAWGSTGMGVTDGYELLGRTVLEEVYLNGQGRLGPAILAAKLVLAGSLPYHQGMVDAYTLLGDPATMLGLRTGERYELFLPSIKR